MRLINLHTFELREFIDSERPPYVILSHTWGSQELTLQQLQQLPHDAALGVPFSYEDKAGYDKIRNFARKGSENGFEWGWVDTCCIDKTSSAELSEAINSMFRWYAEADACYAYLSDVSDQESEGIRGSSLKQQFAASRWFTRGWTLQELLAPSSVTFYLKDWTVYGTKDFLHKDISIITNIPESAIQKTIPVSNYCVGARISWVSRRQTTRPEDLSYCLLGILGVNMPLLYGEGTRAFVRLQEEVLKTSTDSTIFAWPSNAAPPDPNRKNWLSPLAPSPVAFKHCSDYFHILFSNTYGPWTVTNRGLRIEKLPVVNGQEAIDLLTSVGFPISRGEIVIVVALPGCYARREKESVSMNKIGIAMYSNKWNPEIYYRFRTPESLLLVPSSIKISTRLDCIIQLDQFSYHRYRTPENQSSGVPKCILR